jgi:hypothetical protein
VIAGHLVASVWSQCIWSQGIWTRGYLVAGHLVAGHLVAGHLVAGHLVAGHLVALNEKSILTRSFRRESFFCKKGHLQQNLVVFESNWRSGNLAFAFIEEVGEWNPLVFVLFLKVCQNRFFI